MFWNQNNLNEYEKIIKEFNNDIYSTKTIDKYNNIHKAYAAIKKHYEGKIRNKDLDIKSERIRIEQNLGMKSNNIITFSISYYIAIIGTIFYFIFQTLLNNFDIYSKEIRLWVSLAFLIGMLCYVTIFIGNGMEKYKPRNLMLVISLKVLEDIEKRFPEINTEIVVYEQEQLNINSNSDFPEKKVSFM